MADYYTLFSLLVPLKSLAEKAWVEDRIAGGVVTLYPHTADGAENIDLDDRCCFDAEIEPATDGGFGNLWIYSEESGNTDHVIVFLSSWLKANGKRGDFIKFEWGYSCSKPRLDGFGGGAAIITAHRVQSMSTGEWLGTARASLNKRKAKHKGRKKS